ncbi:hypothetical protein TSOC_014609, partial [Tetrabaena socialis]
PLPRSPSGAAARPPLPPPLPPSGSDAAADASRAGWVQVSLVYLSAEVLAQRLAAHVAAARRTTTAVVGGRTGAVHVRGLLLVDVLQARDLLGRRRRPAAPEKGEGGAASGTAAAGEYGSDRAEDSSSVASTYGDSEEEEEEEEEGGGGEGEEERAVAADAAASIIGSDAPLTFGSAGPGLGSLHSNAQAARAAGAAADLAPAGPPPPLAGADGGAIRDRRGRVRCDPYVEVEVTRPRFGGGAAAVAAGGGGGEPETGGGGGGGQGGTFRKRSTPVPATECPSFNLHAEVDDVEPDVVGAMLRIQVWHRRWFMPDARLGRVVLPLSRLLEPTPVPDPGREGLSAGCFEDWLRLQGHGARGGEVRVRLQFLPYLP